MTVLPAKRSTGKASGLHRFSNLRYRLLALVLVPLLLLSGTVIVLASKWYSNYTYEQLFTKVNTDLRVAGESFQRIQKDGQRELSSLAGSAVLSTFLAGEEHSELLALLDLQRALHGFDFLKLLSTDGHLMLSNSGWQAHELRQSPLTDAVLTTDESAAIESSIIGGGRPAPLVLRFMNHLIGSTRMVSMHSRCCSPWWQQLVQHHRSVAMKIAP